jgi:putative transcriptional regulator
MKYRSIAFPLAVAAVLFGIPREAAAQSSEPRDLRAGRILVAARNFPDQTFVESVILLTQYGESGAMGFVINRQTTVPVARAAPGGSEFDTVYTGGPVSQPNVFGLLRSPSNPAQGDPKQAKLVLGDIYLIMERALLEKTLTAKVPADRFHVYMGYVGWGPDQLENELKHGFWYIFNGRPDMVFDAEPDSLWGRLIALTDHQIARVALPRR